ncbi:MAG: DUF1801 domain-containing protein [Candidatus Pacebacteria bacterium]|nr:DUF1801 domain-containing protein [Candidatus Paceibacterota bacterium]MBP9866556.1 DUF1801 domain-containing protein [Candidatus Paceibacterota bacterium]
MKQNTSLSIDSYIATFPIDVQNILQQLRKTVQESAPGAQETIKYGIPTFVLHGNLVHFGGYKKHIGFYPTPSAIEAFKKELSPYKLAKGSVQFKIDAPLPYTLITKIIKFRVKENKISTKKL